MNRNLFELSEEEKSRIRGLHESYINKPGTSLFLEQRDKGDLAPKKRKVKPTKTPNWRGGDSGLVDWYVTSETPRGYPIIAKKVGKDRDYLTVHSTAPRFDQLYYKVPRLEIYEVSGGDLPYPDNMVKPKFESYPEAQTGFNDLVNQIVNYINAGGQVRGATIKGSADSASPTFDIPEGYTELDHNYRGKYTKESLNSLPRNSKERNAALKEMNQILADDRADNYRKEIYKAVANRIGKEKASRDLYIRLLPGDNYFTDENKQSENRGGMYRSITFTPNAEARNVRRPDLIIDGQTQRAAQIVADFHVGGTIITENAYYFNNQVFVNKKTTKVPLIPTGEFLNASIDGNVLKIDNIVFGPITEGKIPESHSLGTSRETKYSGPCSLVLSGQNTITLEDGTKIEVSPVSKYYIGFI